MAHNRDNPFQKYLVNCYKELLGFSLHSNNLIQGLLTILTVLWRSVVSGESVAILIPKTQSKMGS